MNTNHRPPSPELLLRATADMATSIQQLWGMYQSVEAYLANPTLRAAGGEPGRGGDIPDPVHAIVASMGHYDETVATVHELQGLCRALQRRVYATLREHPTLAQEAQQALKGLRCDGSWDPTCTRNAVRNGQCWACYQAKRRAAAEEEAS